MNHSASNYIYMNQLEIGEIGEGNGIATSI